MVSIKDLLSVDKVQAVKKTIGHKETSATKKALFSSTSENTLKKETSLVSKSAHAELATKKVSYQEEPTFYCDLYKNKLAPSIAIKKELFTTFLPEKYLIHPTIISHINRITESSDCISRNYDRKPAERIRYRGRYKDHMKNILEAYDIIFESKNSELVSALENEFIVKATVANANEKGKTRVISLWEKKDNKHFFHMLFIDFYHLFLPSNHAGYTSEKQRQSAYRAYKSNSTCIMKYLTTERIKWLKNI